MKIGIMDSGIGGLTVLKECLQRLSSHEYLYYADSNNAPYGTKTKEEVYLLTEVAVDWLVEKGANIIILACNTATSVAAMRLREKYDIPIIGMEPALKPALQLADNKRVLVLATELTLHQQKFRDLITALDVNALADVIPMTELVTFAEEGDFSSSTIMPFLAKKFADINLELYGSVVLGCTHFPLFKSYFEEFFSVGTVIVDGAAGTANRVKAFVTSHSTIPSVEFFLSGEPLKKGRLFDRIQNILDKDNA